MGDLEKVEGEVDWYEGAIAEEDLLDNVWLGVGAAVEWIAFRGDRVPAADHDKRIEEASKALLTTLQKRANDGGRAVVLGKKGDRTEKRQPIPDSVWWEEITLDIRLFDVGGRYYLSLVGDDDEWGASVEGRDERWSDLAIDTQFVLVHWKPKTPESGPPSQGGDTVVPRRNEFSVPKAERLLQKILADWPSDELPLSKAEFVAIFRIAYPSASRDRVKALPFIKDLPSNTGPRGPRDPDRKVSVR
ncbi:hypothetical protein ACSBOB_19770 [Mesorhizobium sp. ASY16-5R]|uniref:hypothetical protein n=1 Tax=Mesorhizobium sp. ASY16-5R TaxID=3445772 RepID=UPI003F9FCAAA